MNPIQFITEKEYEAVITRDRELGVSNQISAAEYEETFWSVSERIKQALSAIGTPHEGIPRGCDFWMNHGFDECPRLSVEIHGTRMIRPELITIIQTILSASGIRWRVDVSHDILTEPFFYLLVYKDKLLATGDINYLSRKLTKSEK